MQLPLHQHTQYTCTHTVDMYTRTHTFTYSFVLYDSVPGFLLVLAQWGNTALLKAAYGGSVPLVRTLLEDYGSSVDEVNEVSCYSNVRCYLVTMSEVCLVACSVQL